MLLLTGLTQESQVASPSLSAVRSIDSTDLSGGAGWTGCCSGAALPAGETWLSDVMITALARACVVGTA